MQNIMPFQHYLDSDLAKQCSKDHITAKTIFTALLERIEYRFDALGIHAAIPWLLLHFCNNIVQAA